MNELFQWTAIVLLALAAAGNSLLTLTGLRAGVQLAGGLLSRLLDLIGGKR